MKTIRQVLLAGAGAIGAWHVWSKVQQEREERELWAEVTDAFGEVRGQELPYTPSEG